MYNGRQDTIAALATPQGRGGVAIVRISGAEALAIGSRMAGIKPRPRIAHVCIFRDKEGQRIDKGLMLFFPGPKSFTGEDVVELHGHGGAVVSEWLLTSAYRMGARAAEAGEFTLRAFLNEKLDLAQAEAIEDLVNSGSRQAARAALRSLDGDFSKSVHAMQAQLTELRVHIEAWLDFPDEEMELENTGDLERRLESLKAQSEALVTGAGEGRVLRDGLYVVIAGPPNAGKSSLLNKLAGHETAIVTHIPGTTRDILREQLSLDGLPVSLADTAGLRESSDPVEIEGSRRAHQELKRADCVLWVTDIQSAGIDQAYAEARHELGDNIVWVLVRNKVDLVADTPGIFNYEGVKGIRISALTGQGVSLVVQHLKETAGYAGDSSGTFSARSRHVDGLIRAKDHIEKAADRLTNNQALELSAEELKLAQNALGEITGELTSDDLLGEIFSSFCIGK